ncbi:MAG: conjugative transposon protein TraK [Bacteroidetes bacterium]|uniref:Conjugative transposon protein TraK n=1 Tax=Candidatus Cryptobacteroides merdigallinarum TaxID=2840770 RepID=A0A9D9EM44_9BACT|nr:conjugative transposon protein TraK [Candidatus Cryptobacteroides merdigallinarum]
MEKIIKELTTIKSSMSNMRTAAISALVTAGLVAVASTGLAIMFVRENSSNIYILDRGTAATASLGEADSQRELEVRDHVIRFHELMMNLSPSSDAIKTNIDRALTMSDRSAFNYWQDLSETGFYNRLVSANISQQFSLDSISTDMASYPYRLEVFGKLYLIRESNITAYRIRTSCQLVDIGRSKDNPHGLMIEQFRVVSNDKIGTRKRN